MRGISKLFRTGELQTSRRMMADAAPRLVLVGCGAIAETFYLPSLRRFPALLEKLVLVDSDRERVQRLASAFGVARVAVNYQEVVPDVDAAIVAVPHSLHYRVAMDFLIRGVHVLCEKPLAEVPAEAREMVAQAEQAGVTLAVNNTRRLFPSSRKVKELLLAGAIGSVRSITFMEGQEFIWPTASGFYFNSRVSPKGVVLDIGAHVLDLICWWIGVKPVLVLSENDSFGGCEAVASIALKHDNLSAEVRLSRLTKLENTFTIIGDRGTIMGNVHDWWHLYFTSENGRGRAIKLKSEARDYADFGPILIDNFVGALANTVPPLVPASQVLDSIELIAECYERAQRFNLPWYDAVELCDGRR